MVELILAASEDDSGAAAGFAVVVLVVLSFIVYWVPTVIAFIRAVPNKASVLVINLFLGWTLIGWVVALAMSVRSKT
ncbi:superinfection immunity protein [Mycobacterium frederiksbergense]|uniref:superinfection immunity protein n=1 Tax=Mycolicibacterium frederiksbergense TaxID=117567 RepID=UPI0021F25829|nr:superinfection immunity protein [Mycolicibacterium frederiksbergense]MCV7048946.1 superinfection immunity protein [Mycolicibacterium frederiksbergense]